MQMTIGLDGKVILISGGTKGVGRGVALECSRSGATVIFTGRDCKSAEILLAEMSGNGGLRGLFFEHDVRNVSACADIVGEVERKFGRIDGFFYYSGITPVASLVETEESLFDEIMDINLKGAYFMCKHVVRSMVAHGGGSIVLNGSAHGYGGEADRAAYAVSKGALLTLCRHIHKNYIHQGVRANWISMGWVATPGEVALREAQGHPVTWLNDMAREQIPLGRLPTVEDHVPGIIYLLSDLSSAVSGVELKITGGFDA
jgi:NAD(P)-dependent dehydrogenase (short-subunit alcohol dehydrogenase family)